MTKRFKCKTQKQPEVRIVVTLVQKPEVPGVKILEMSNVHEKYFIHHQYKIRIWKVERKIVKLKSKS